ncbi:unnamed protein product [Durusdinium trenchii]|uniref:Plastid lipid-associated protein/fibrillin conserved domain-containing protein n=1 Tax=Durusdinium trenchii TaxID=1381693 RepID=A0ABP0Q6Q6_9DINO
MHGVRKNARPRMALAPLTVWVAFTVPRTVSLVLPGDRAATAALKKDLLGAVASGAQEEIFRKAKELEDLGLTESPVAGRWSLVYSTQTAADVKQEESIFSTLTAALYRLFFRFAPFLAGGQDKPKAGRDGMAVPKPPKAWGPEDPQEDAGKMPRERGSCWSSHMEQQLRGRSSWPLQPFHRQRAAGGFRLKARGQPCGATSGNLRAQGQRPREGRLGGRGSQRFGGYLHQLRGGVAQPAHGGAATAQAQGPAPHQLL